MSLVCVFKIPKELFIKKSSKIRAITPLSRGAGGVCFFYPKLQIQTKDNKFCNENCIYLKKTIKRDKTAIIYPILGHSRYCIAFIH